MTEFNKTDTEQPANMHDTKLADALRTAGTASVTEELLQAAADRIERFNRFSGLIGLLAPAGTAPRTALEQIYIQSAQPSVETSPIVLELRGMLHQHWGEWTPAVREAEGLPPATPDSSNES